MADENKEEKKEGGLLGKMLGAFIEVNDDEKGTEVKPPDKPVATTASQSPPTTQTSVYSSNPAIESNKFVGPLREAISDKGTVLKKMLDLVRDFSEDIPNESMRFKAAMKIITREGGSVEQVMSGFEMQRQSLEMEAKKIRSSFSSLEEDIKGQEGQVANINGQIDSLQKQIEALAKQRTDITSEIAATQAKVQQNKNLAESAIAYVAAEIQRDESNITANLKGGK